MKKSSKLFFEFDDTFLFAYFMRDRCLNRQSVKICAAHITLHVHYIDVSLSDMQNVLLLWNVTHITTAQVMSMNSILACRFLEETK